MSGKSNFLDYEPLTRPSNTQAGEVEDFKGQVFKPAKEVDETSKIIKPTKRGSLPETHEPVPSVESAPIEADEIEPLKADWVPKRSHGLSFAGLFLFTLVLYVRPYELFSSLMWMKSAAFWIAVATIAVFIPTQLGLDGRITVPIREVKLVLLLLVGVVLSIPLATDPPTAWNGFTDFVKVVLMFIVLVNVVRTEARLTAMLLLVLTVSAVFSFAAISDFSSLGTLAFDAESNSGTRVKGLVGGMFDNPNDLALHLVTMIPIALGLMLRSRSLLKKILFLVPALLMTGGVVVTYSRGGFLGLVVAVGVLLWRLARRNRWVIAIVAPVALCAFVVLAPSGYGSRLATTNDGSATARTGELKKSLYMTIRHPLFGVGMGNYVIYSSTSHATHNAYTQVGADLGVASMLVYILFQLASLRSLRRVERETRSQPRTNGYYYLAVGLEASLIGYMVSSFFASVAFQWYIYYLVGYAICFRNFYVASNSKAKEADKVPLAKPVVGT